MRFLVLFRGIHNDFRVAELYSVVAMQRRCSERQCAVDLRLSPALSTIEPSHEVSRDVAGVILHGHIMCFIELQSVEEARNVCQRCVLVRAILIPLGHGHDYNECVSSLACATTDQLCLDMLSTEKPQSFKCVVESFGRKHQTAEQVNLMEKFGPVLFNRFTGEVCLKSPDVEFYILEDAFPAGGHKMGVDRTQPRQVLLGRFVASGAANLGHEYHLSRRKMLGPTSTNAELSFVMANMAHIGPGSIVLDPFCGTGSILVSCAAKGAVVVGADLDMQVLRGKAQTKSAAMDVNFAQYGLPRPAGVLRADILRASFRKRPWVDAVVCDPPYGVREGAKSVREDSLSRASEDDSEYVPGMERVRFVDMLSGLLTFAAERLVPGGRLVYWLPTTPEYRDEDVPRSKAFRLVANSDQPMTMRMHRRLITMVKLNDAEMEEEQEIATGTSILNTECRPPAHDDFSAKVMRQPTRSESRMRARTHPFAH
jgi:tRNA (guanine10-N2)-methyltransferase